MSEPEKPGAAGGTDGVGVEAKPTQPTKPISFRDIRELSDKTAVVLDAFAGPVSTFGDKGQDAAELMQAGAKAIRSGAQAAEAIAKEAKPAVDALKALVKKAEQKGVIKMRPAYEPKFATRKPVQPQAQPQSQEPKK